MGFQCSSCGEWHEGFPALTAAKPDHWLSLTEEQRRAGECDTDICVTPDGHYFVYGTLEIPVLSDIEPRLDLGVWSTLSADNFNRYMDRLGDEDRVSLGPMFGWLSNEVQFFPGSLNLKLNVWPQKPGLRPLFEVEPTDHPLSLAQRNGIPFEDALDYVHSVLKKL